ncbi:TPA: class I SAM-dependent methyltransferase [Acinetobacter baumannii]|nr:class I SAM-dependent methyltransferase [Acinetobacter baumannii]
MQNQHDLNQRQYSDKSEAYLKSSVHAQGIEFSKMQNLVAQYNFKNLLDLGCGGGHVTYHLAPFTDKITAYDLTPEMVHIVSEQSKEKGLSNVSTQIGMAESLPFDDQTFDCIISRYSAHHWQNVRQAMDEIHRVLQTNGKVIIFDIVGSSNPILDTFLQTIEIMRDPSHVRDYSLEEWMSFAEYAGFHVEAIESQQLELNFQTWVERMKTPSEVVAAIRYLQTQMSNPVKDYYQIQDDGTFTSKAAFIVLTKN